MREFLKSDTFKEFKEKNPQIDLNVVNKQGSHPFLTSLYINGYLKDIPLRNVEEENILEYFKRARNTGINLWLILE